MSYQLLQGDCRAVLAAMDADSLDSPSTGNRHRTAICPFPLRRHVAGMTKCHDIFESVGFVGICKGRHWPEVVDVQMSPHLSLRDSAALAGVAISRSGKTPNPRPVWSVVGFVAASPNRITGAALRQTNARDRAILRLSPIHVCLGKGNGGAALPAWNRLSRGSESLRLLRRRNLRRFPFRGIAIRIGDNSFRAPEAAPAILASPRAIHRAVTDLSTFGWRDQYRAFASGTRHFFGGLQAISAHKVGATAATSGLPAVLQAAGVGLVRDFADGAHPINAIHYEIYTA